MFASICIHCRAGGKWYQTNIFSTELVFFIQNHSDYNFFEMKFKISIYDLWKIFEAMFQNADIDSISRQL